MIIDDTAPITTIPERPAVVDLSTERGWAYAWAHILLAHGGPVLTPPRLVFDDAGIRVIACGSPTCTERWVEPIRRPEKRA